MSMDELKAVVAQLLTRLPAVRGRGEEATKQALVLPILDALGYDIWNPAEVCPEFDADFAIGTAPRPSCHRRGPIHARIHSDTWASCGRWKKRAVFSGSRSTSICAGVRWLAESGDLATGADAFHSSEAAGATTAAISRGKVMRG